MDGANSPRTSYLWMYTRFFQTTISRRAINVYWYNGWVKLFLVSWLFTLQCKCLLWLENHFLKSFESAIQGVIFWVLGLVSTAILGKQHFGKHHSHPSPSCIHINIASFFSSGTLSPVRTSFTTRPFKGQSSCLWISDVTFCLHRQGPCQRVTLCEADIVPLCFVGYPAVRGRENTA